MAPLTTHACARWAPAAIGCGLQTRALCLEDELCSLTRDAAAKQDGTVWGWMAAAACCDCGWSKCTQVGSGFTTGHAYSEALRGASDCTCGQRASVLVWSEMLREVCLARKDPSGGRRVAQTSWLQ
jgi:hypothetical protein